MSLHTRGPVVTGVEEMLPAEEETERAPLEFAANGEQRAVSECESASQHGFDLSQFEMVPPMTSEDQGQCQTPLALQCHQ